jgi:hypothetical protein
VIDSITEDREEYYGFDESDFPDASSDGRVKLLLSYPWRCPTSMRCRSSS